MSEKMIVASIFLGLIAAGSGGIALLVLFQTVTGLGAGGLALTGIPILVLGGICAFSIAAIARLTKMSDT